MSQNVETKQSMMLMLVSQFTNTVCMTVVFLKIKSLKKKKKIKKRFTNLYKDMT